MPLATLAALASFVSLAAPAAQDQVVDPFLSGPVWSAEGSESRSGFAARIVAGGDVDGDAHADVLIAEDALDAPELDAGALHLYRGSPGGIEAAPSWTRNGSGAGARLGFASAFADVNGDGLDDVLVGAPGGELSDFRAASLAGAAPIGEAFLFLGSPAGLAATSAWSFAGAPGELLGAGLGNAGDVDGDGCEDVLVASLGGRGRVRLFLGSPAGLSAVPALELVGEQGGALFGEVARGVGDVDGDGHADLVVAAPRFSGEHRLQGKLTLYLGDGAGGFVASGSLLGAGAGAAFGRELAAGDLDLDGLADVVVSSWPRTHVYLGSPAGLVAAPWSAPHVDHSTDVDLGDVDADGVLDVIVARESDRFAVFHGTGAAPGTYPAWIAAAEETDVVAGRRAVFAGDVDGDGLGDVLAGVPRRGEPDEDVGRVHAYLGRLDPVLPAAPDWEVGGGPGCALADVNGDGFEDAVIGDPGYSGDHGLEGAAYAYLGGPGGLASSPSWMNEGNQTTPSGETLFFGLHVGSPGDVNGDGYDEVIVTAQNWKVGFERRGRAKLFAGSATGLGANPAWQRTGASSADRIIRGDAAGDVNGDGFDDVLLTLRASASGTPGSAEVFLGSAAGVSTTLHWESPTHSWVSVCGGDVNGDGYSDVVLTHTDNGGGNQPFVKLYLGSSAGLGASPSQTHTQHGSYDHVASVGDLDGDGFGDVVTSNFDVFFGSAAGLVPGPDQDYPLRNGIPARAGDVDGDGHADVLAYLRSHDRLALFRGGPAGIAPLPAWRWYAEGSGGNDVWLRAGDVDGDGRPEVLAAEWGAARLFAPLP